MVEATESEPIQLEVLKYEKSEPNKQAKDVVKTKFGGLRERPKHSTDELYSVLQ